MAKKGTRTSKKGPGMAKNGAWMLKNELELIIFKYNYAVWRFYKKTDAKASEMLDVEVNGSEVKIFCEMLKINKSFPVAGCSRDLWRKTSFFSGMLKISCR
jgi:hypothetical protein